MSKDWTSNTQSFKVGVCASNLSLVDRETHDYYATEPKAIKLLLEIEKFSSNIWECACGELHLSNELKKAGKDVFNTDIIERKQKIDKVLDFISFENNIKWGGI